MNLTLYGPPGSGKTTVGQALAARLGREFVDADAVISARASLTIPEIFAKQGEDGFRRIESEVIAELTARDGLVIAPGGGALLDPANRVALERSGPVFCLRANADVLLARMQSEGNRPLLVGDDPAVKLGALLKTRRELYDSFAAQIETDGKTIQQVVDEIRSDLEPRRLPVNAPGLRHDIVLGYGLLERLVELLAADGLTGSTLMVTDENIMRALPHSTRHRRTQSVRAFVTIPTGEQHKTLDTVRTLYDAFLRHGLDRQSAVIAVGGGVIGDMVGFAAATYMRGVRWVNVPTTLLAMVDASLGGKTGVDLPQGKNLVGAFHPPVLVVSDPLVLNTLLTAERTAGMAEVVKHGLIDDAELFAELERSVTFGSVRQIERAIAVKVRVVEEDPFELGRRAVLNLGHTVGHGVEAASGFRLRHGEAVAIGLAAETHIAEQMGLAESGLAARIEHTLTHLGLPTHCPNLDPNAIRMLMSADKKKAGGKLKFALPKRVGEVAWGVEVDETLLAETLNAITLPPQ
ncbi:MAG: 3-dehydroquinate synthase [Anaerolineales bacterium]